MPYSWNGSVEQVNGVADFVFYWGRFYCWANLEITSHYEHVSPETDPITTSSATERPSVATRSSHLKMGWYEKNLRNHSTFTRFKSWAAESDPFRTAGSPLHLTFAVRCVGMPQRHSGADHHEEWQRCCWNLLSFSLGYSGIWSCWLKWINIETCTVNGRVNCCLFDLIKIKFQRRWIIFWWTNNCAVTKSSSDASGWNLWLVIDQSVTCFYCGSFIWISAIFW